MTPEEHHDGFRIDELIPGPVPSAYRLLNAGEREWRGRACIVLWLTGFSSASAWRMALSRDEGWSAYLRADLPPCATESLAIGVLRKRLMAAQARS